MTEIISGELRYNELTANANGGTELMARRIASDVPQELLEGVQIIHSRVRELEPGMKRILVNHDLASDPETARLADREFRKNFDKIVFVSNWQQHTFNMIRAIPYSESVVIRNGIEVEFFEEKPTDGPIRLIYHTTPHRGLELLIPAFEEASKHYDLHLDIFSSFSIYGWGERDEPYKPLFEKIDSLPNVTNHGFNPNHIVRDYLKQSHIFAFPSQWQETSCLAMIEAMAFGNLVVHSNLGALPETSIGLTSQYMFDEDPNRHVNRFYQQLVRALEFVNNNRKNMTTSHSYIANHAQSYYNWNTIKQEWIQLLKEIKND